MRTDLPDLGWHDRQLTFTARIRIKDKKRFMELQKKHYNIAKKTSPDDKANAARIALWTLIDNNHELWAFDYIGDITSCDGLLRGHVCDDKIGAWFSRNMGEVTA